MKKLYLSLALCMAFLVSCSKIEGPSNENLNPEESTSDEQNVPEGMVRLNFNVKSDPELKTSWDGENHKWSEGDQIRIFWGTGESDYNDAEVIEKSGSYSVSAVVPEDVETLYAVYPTTATYALDDGSVTVTIPRYQSGTFADANIMAAKTTKTEASLDFKNMTSILKFKTGASINYNQVTFGANALTKMNGTVTTSFADDYATSTIGTTDPLLTVSKLAADTEYYLAVLPGNAIADGIGFKVENVTKGTSLIAGGLSKGSFSRVRSKVTNLGVLDSKIISDWYITTDGTGNGASQDSPANVSRLIDLLVPSYSSNGTTAAWRLHNATIHVAGGRYNLQEANGGNVLTPHWNASNIKVYIKGEGNAQNPTEFVCNQANANDRVFLLSGSNKVVDLTFENVSFPANDASLAPGTAFDFNSSADSKITFKDCSFTGFVQSGTINGGPIYARGSGKAKMYFDGCTFSNNNCNVGGAIYVYNSNSTVSFTNTTFSSNVAQNGGSIRARAGKVEVNNCTFTGLGIEDADENTAKQGGAFYIDGADVTINGGSINSCKVNSNSGAIYFGSGKLNMDGVQIKDCKSANQGGGIWVNAGQTANISNCSFESCTAVTGAAIYTAAGTGTSYSKAIVFNTSFKSNVATGGSASGAGPNGGCIYSQNYTNSLYANCTFSDNTVKAGGVLSIGRGSDTKDFNRLYIVGCTVYGGSTAVTRTSTVIRIYNSIIPGSGSTTTNVKVYSSIYNSDIFGAAATKTTSSITFALGSYTNGVYPLMSDYESSYTQGMAADAIQALTFDDLGEVGAITLTDEQKALLAKDQKGNDRTGTIMGAYVLTTAPVE